MAYQKPLPPKPEHRINEQIRVLQVRLIDENGAMVGVVQTDQARQMARERNYDLVEVSPDAAPPVCKLLDYGKFKYELKKKTKKAKKKQHTQLVKEVRLRPLTEDHDVHTKIKHAREFLLNGDKVLFTVFFKGREMAHRDIGLQMMNKIKAELDDVGKVEHDVNMMGPRMHLTMMPKPGGKPGKPSSDKGDGTAGKAAPTPPKPKTDGAAAPALSERSESKGTPAAANPPKGDGHGSEVPAQ